MSNHAHLITSVTGVWLLKPEVFIQCSQRTGSREGPGHTHNSNTPCLKDPSQSSADWPPETHEQSHKNRTASTRPKMHTAPTRAHLISCVGGATPPPHNHTHFAPSRSRCCSSGPQSTQSHPSVGCLINCHGLTFDLLPRPPRPLRWRGVKVPPPIVTSRSCYSANYGSK